MSNTPVLESVPDVEVVTLPNPDDMVICDWPHQYIIAESPAAAIIAIVTGTTTRENGTLPCLIEAKWIASDCMMERGPVCDNARRDMEEQGKLGLLSCPKCHTCCVTFRPL